MGKLKNTYAKIYDRTPHPYPQIMNPPTTPSSKGYSTSSTKTRSPYPWASRTEWYCCRDKSIQASLSILTATTLTLNLSWPRRDKSKKGSMSMSMILALLSRLPTKDSLTNSDMEASFIYMPIWSKITSATAPSCYSASSSESHSSITPSVI